MLPTRILFLIIAHMLIFVKMWLLFMARGEEIMVGAEAVLIVGKVGELVDCLT